MPVLGIIDEARKNEIAYCVSDPVYFVQNYVHIEDKDSEEIIVPFDMWDAQKEALQSIHDHRLNIILKARQLGITWLSLGYAAWMLIQPGKTVVAMSRTENEAKELTRRLDMIVSNMPELILSHTASSQVVSVQHENGLTSTFQAFPAAAGAARSFTANLVILDEWAFQQFARDIWKSAYPTINRPTGGKVIGLSTIKRGTLFEDLWREQDNGFNHIFIPWYADPRRTHDWYEATRKAIGEDGIMAEYPATPEEALTIAGGAFFPEVRQHIHQVDHVPSGECRRYISMDYGLDKLACYFHHIDRQGDDIVYREIAMSGLIVSEAAAVIKAAMGNEDIDCAYAPPDLWNRNRDTGRSTAEIFISCGIPMRKTSNDRVQGWLDLKEWLAPYEVRDEHTGEKKLTAHMRFLEGETPYIWKCLREIQKDENRPNDCANDPHELTHGPDALRAFAAGRPRAYEAPAPAKDPMFDEPDYEDQVAALFEFGG